MVRTNQKFWIHFTLFVVVWAVAAAYISEGLAVACLLLVWLVVISGLFILKDDTIQKIKAFCIEAVIGSTLVLGLLLMLTLLVCVLAEVSKYR